MKRFAASRARPTPGMASRKFARSAPWRKTLSRACTSGEDGTESVMIYYTIYLKRLNNGTGYVDIALHDDQLLKDFEQYLHIGVRAHRLYKVADTPGAANAGGFFTVDMAEISAITAMYKNYPAGGRSRGNTDFKKK